MKRVVGRLAINVAVGLATGPFALTGANASDIACHLPPGGWWVQCEDPGYGMLCMLVTDARPRPQHLICDSSALLQRYERIYAEQQRMLHKGIVGESDILAWRARRDSCDSARCLDSMFRQFWRQRDAVRNAPGRPASPPQAAGAMPDPARHTPAPATASTSMPTPRAQGNMPLTKASAWPVSRKPARRLPKSAIPEEAPPAGQSQSGPTAKAAISGPGESRAGALVLQSLLSGLAVVGAGAGFLWNRRGVGAQGGPRPAIPAAMVIVFGLLVVNALLLPFTLGLK